MAKTDSDTERFNRIVVWSLGATAVLLLILPMFFVLSNVTYYSAYVDSGDTDEEKETIKNFDESILVFKTT